MGPCPKNADAVLANANKLTAAVVDDLAHERMAGLFLTSWATEPFRRIILTNAGVIIVRNKSCAQDLNNVFRVQFCLL